MKEFLLNNWYYIVLAVLAVATFICSLVIKRKANNNFLDSVKAALLENIPTWAVFSEGLISGADKKNNVISLGIALVSKMLGRKLSAEENSYFVAFISEQLEKILSAPQKKLYQAKNEPKSKYRAD